MTAEQPFPTPPGEQSGNAIDAIRTAIRIDMINWQSPDLELYDFGGYSVVYRIAPGLIAKVGLIEEDEVIAQNYFARLHKAVPVIDYQSEVETSAEVRTA